MPEARVEEETSPHPVGGLGSRARAVETEEKWVELLETAVPATERGEGRAGLHSSTYRLRSCIRPFAGRPTWLPPGESRQAMARVSRRRRAHSVY